MDVQVSDFITIGLLVLLEGLLSADNALVLAMMILGLPRGDQKKALRYGLVGAFAFRTAATLLATWLIRIDWVKVLGGLYLLYLCYEHFFRGGGQEAVVCSDLMHHPLQLRYPGWSTRFCVDPVQAARSKVSDDIVVENGG